MSIFPTRASLIWLVGMVLAEQEDECQDGRCYFRPESMALIDAVDREDEAPALLMASWSIRRDDEALLHHVLRLDRDDESARTP